MNLNLLANIIKDRKKTFLAMLILIAVNICSNLYSNLMQKPTIERYRTEWFERRSKEGLQQAEGKVAIYEQGVKDLKTWEERIYAKKDFARFLGDLFEIVGKDSVALGSITYKPVKEKNAKLLAYSIALSIAGNYGAVKKFIGDVGDMRSMTVIENISVSNNHMTEERIDLRMQIIS